MCDPFRGCLFFLEIVARILGNGEYLLNTALHFEDAKRGWIASELRPGNELIYIYRTADGGETWTRELRSSLNTLKLLINDILLDEGGKGWACGAKMLAAATNGAGTYFCVLRTVVNTYRQILVDSK